MTDPYMGNFVIESVMRFVDKLFFLFLLVFCRRNDAVDPWCVDLEGQASGSAEIDRSRAI